ncbi:GNAT family N-acetyltransferase [Nodosilinea sp. FACHB-13]|uniref:GNAT family N-acetyltransferase n=1 Tax=Cyanophyceae TaxID=3028117 RepID=UPI001681D9B3|nr:GNAT family N-acetyltransferase [Nodosilinea sp. FACHB-13]MBD2107024.1 GNAT family N-acetyltransferase [Nodosilinea sp. FACHB-13]
MIITGVRESEREELLSLAVSTGLFTPEDAEGLLGGILDGLAAGGLPEGHMAVACRKSHDSEAIGWSYYAPDPYAENILNVWWIGVAPEHHGSGAGHVLLLHIEKEARDQGVRVVVIETSDQAPMARARKFYDKQGYAERGRIPDFYGQGDAKVIFSRSLASAP